MATEGLRELDAWIAEHVMGWKPAISPLQSRDETVPRYWNKGNGGFNMVSMTSFTPSTDPADAMLVLEKCANRCTVTIEYGASADNRVVWMVARLDSEDDYAEVDCKCADTLPLAICIFAKQLFHP